MRYDELANRVLDGGTITKAEALEILQCEDRDLRDLLSAARRLREQAFGKDVILHVLQNAKSGSCPEDCAFCSQSTHFETDVEQYRIQTADEMFEAAKAAYELGASRYCMVTSTRKPTIREVRTVCEATQRIKAEFPLEICASLGFLNTQAAELLAASGVDRFNHNLETSESHYETLVSTHSWRDRVKTVQAAKSAGMEACCGGIVGMGEVEDDRVELAFSLRDLEVDSIPVNFLDPRPGTPLGDCERLSAEACLKTIAMMRFVNPTKDIRVAGGREKALGDKQGLALYAANSMFTQGYLTTGGQGYDEDILMIEEAGFKVSTIQPG